MADGCRTRMLMELLLFHLPFCPTLVSVCVFVPLRQKNQHRKDSHLDVDCLSLSLPDMSIGRVMSAFFLTALCSLTRL